MTAEIFPLIARAAAVLVMVLGLAILALYGLRRLLGIRGRAGLIQVTRLASYHFAPKQRIELIEIEGKRLLLGISPNCITYLTDLSESPEKRADTGDEEEL